MCGLPGAGKTTLALQLARDLGAIRLCPDEWMMELGIDVFDEGARNRIEHLQWQLAQELLPLDNRVIIEWGLWSRSERDARRARARNLGAGVELRFVDPPLDILWERLKSRGMEQRWGSRAIERHELEHWARALERPGEDELALFDPPLR